MSDSNDQDHLAVRSKPKKWFSLIAGTLACILICSVITGVVYALWLLGDIQANPSVEGQLMHRKTQAMTQILDAMVRGDLGRVESSAERMRTIGHKIDWYLSHKVCEKTNEDFRDSTLGLIQAAKQRDHAAAKESALRLERSCIECHALINVAKSSEP